MDSLPIYESCYFKVLQEENQLRASTMRTGRLNVIVNVQQQQQQHEDRETIDDGPVDM